jgi:putative transposase
MSAQELIEWLCIVFDVNIFDATRSCYYTHRLRRRTPDVERLPSRQLVNELFTQVKALPVAAA